MDDADPEVIDLSNVLNALPLHTQRPDVEKFRNPNGVSLKLANFARLDPNYQGKGMSRGNRLEAEVWERFYGHRDELQQVAQALRSGVTEFPVIPEEEEADAEEGRLLYRQHRARERDRKLVAKKKAAAASLACEVCGFDFGKTYGQLGEGFVECHHLKPLAEGVRRTNVADLALLCSNCHRMAHRQRPWPTVRELRALLR